MARPMSMIEKIIGKHLTDSCKEMEGKAGDIVDITIDVRAARDFGGPNVVKNLREKGLKIDDPSKTVFTFDCNPTGSDQKYAANQHICRMYAREQGIKVFDIDQGIGTHIAIENGLIKPGGTFVSTDSHANIMGAIGTFGQGMGDIDIAACWARGAIWFKIPKPAKVVLKGVPSKECLPKDVALKMAETLGANGLLGYAAEVVGDYVDGLSLDGRITIASMGTEMGAIILLFKPNEAVLIEIGLPVDFDLSFIAADENAKYEKVIEIDIDGLKPMMARPGHPDDGVTVESVRGRPIDSCFIGSCTNGRMSDMRQAAAILKGKKIAHGIVLKIVPSTRRIWEQCCEEGLVKIFMDAGALVGNCGCAGCAAGQVGQNGPQEVTISSGNRNFPGKQGKGEVYLASPSTVASCALAGCITSSDMIDFKPTSEYAKAKVDIKLDDGKSQAKANIKFEGRVWVVAKDDIDTDMIFHNSHLQITDINQMGQHAFGNLPGWTDFSKKCKPGDLLITGKNFGCGSSRQQAVDCFKNLGVQLIVAKSFGAIYERNAINSGFPIMIAPEMDLDSLTDGDVVEVDLAKSTLINKTKNVAIPSEVFSPVQMDIYKRGGLLCKSCDESW